MEVGEWGGGVFAYPVSGPVVVQENNYDASTMIKKKKKSPIKLIIKSNLQSIYQSHFYYIYFTSNSV